jgi:hypothetical protein
MKQIIKNLLLIASIPFIMFWLAIGICFLIFPNDLDNSLYTIIFSTLLGAVTSIALIIKDTIKLIKERK